MCCLVARCGTCVRKIGRGRWPYSPRFVVACVRTWLLVVCGQLSSFVGGQLCFLGSHGGSAVIGGCWHSWVIRRAVVVKSMVGGGDEHGWWWWEEEMVVVKRKWLPNKHCLFVWEGVSQVQIHTWDHHMYDLTWWSQTGPMDIHWTFHGIQFFFSWTQVGLCTELQDITIERQFPLYSVQIPPEYQIPRSVQWNSRTQAGFQVEYQGESKDLNKFTISTGSYHLHHVFSTVAVRHLDQLP